jgi:hypothetical protein
VVLFGQVKEWEEIALVRAYKTKVNRELSTITADGSLERLESIKFAEIRGLICRIEKQLADRKVVYLVEEW